MPFPDCQLTTDNRQLFIRQNELFLSVSHEEFVFPKRPKFAKKQPSAPKRTPGFVAKAAKDFFTALKVRIPGGIDG